MTMGTVTRADLCEVVYQKVGLSRTECAVLVELVLTEIMDCLERGETMKLSSFGSFAVRMKGQRIGRNPKTGIEVPISPRRVMVFKASEILKWAIQSRPANGDLSMGASVRKGRYLRNSRKQDTKLANEIWPQRPLPLRQR